MIDDLSWDEFQTKSLYRWRFLIDARFSITFVAGRFSLFALPSFSFAPLPLLLVMLYIGLGRPLDGVLHRL